MSVAPHHDAGRGAFRTVIRTALDGVGLLDASRRTRDLAAALTWVRHNRRFLRHGGDDGLPVPTARLRILTTASPSVEWFIQSGRAAADSIRELLARNDVPAADIDRMLDFGCGCGRVVRHWAHEPAQVHGCDVGAELVDWCSRRLPFAHFETNDLMPPLPYADASFDLVYALSVFTHLPHPLQQPWMRELSRVLTPTGHLIVSTHGEGCLETLTEVERHGFREGRLVVRNDDEAGTNRCGVFCSEDYVRHHLAPGFVVRDFVPRGARGNPPQDLVLLQTRAASDPATSTPALTPPGP